MGSIEIGLWLSLVFTILVYIWVGKVYISQPRFNRPRLFWNPVVALILSNVPFVGFLGITIAGFILTEHGWWFLGVSVASFFIFAVRPQGL